MGYKAVFLDRDGVINEECEDYVKDVSEFKLIEGSLDAIKLLKEKKISEDELKNSEKKIQNLI